MSPKQNSNPLNLWAAGFVVVTAVLSLAIERFRDVTFGRALATAAILVVGIAVLTLAIIGIRRERSSRKRDRNVENDEADSSLADDSPPNDDSPQQDVEPEPSPGSESRLAATGSEPEDSAATAQDFTATGEIDTGLVQAALAGVPDPLPALPTVPEPKVDTSGLDYYFKKLHPWSYIRRVVFWAIFQVVSLIAIAFVSFVEGPWTNVFTASPSLQTSLFPLWLITLLIGTVMAARGYKIFTIRPLECDPRTGILYVYETGSRLWLIADSPKDQYPLSEVIINTPKRSWWEFYVLEGRSATLILTQEGEEPRVIKWVRDVEKIKDIAAAYRAIASRQLDTQGRILEEQMRTNQLLEQILATNLEVKRTVTQLPRR